ATGPEFMTDHLRSLAAIATCWTSVYPNAGLPDERGQYGETPQSLALKLARFVDERWVNLVGGCCGTTPEHIRAIARLVAGKPPRVPATAEPQGVSGLEVLYPGDHNRPVLVGEERFERVAPLLRAYGAAVVVGCIDENKQQGMAVTRQRKLAIAERSHELLTRKYGIPARDLIFDPLVFPVGTGDANYIGSAVETIEGLRAIKARFPECKTILGISNVSFGLPPAGREVLNGVFLYHCTKAGLDYAIINTER